MRNSAELLRSDTCNNHIFFFDEIQTNVSLHLYVGRADITQAQTYSEAAIYNNESGGRACFFSNAGTQKGILSLDYNQDDQEDRGGMGGLRIKDATVSNKEVAV